MEPDPDDPTLQHSHFTAEIPGWAASSAFTRALVRREVRRRVQTELAEKGWAQTGPECWHFGEADGVTMVMVHFTARDLLAAAFADSEAGR